jgi:hypothetical protein
MNKPSLSSLFSTWAPGLLWCFFGVMMLLGIGGTLASVYAAEPPMIVTYQGKLLQSGRAVTGDVNMSISLYDAADAGNRLYSAALDGGQAAEIAVSSTLGVFTLAIGGDGTLPLDPELFADNDAVYLELTIEGTTLTPRTRIHATPYAINARFLNGSQATSTPQGSAYIPVANNDGTFSFSGLGINSSSPQYDLSVSGTSYFSGTTTLATTTVQGPLEVTDVLTVSGNGGTTPSQIDTPLILNDQTTINANTTINSSLRVNQQVYFEGGARNPSYIGEIHPNGPGGQAEFEGVRDIAVQGGYVYSVNDGAVDSFTITSISDPANPEILASVTQAGSGAPINSPRKIVVKGNYAYIISNEGQGSLSIFDVGQPSFPLFLGSVTYSNADGITALNTPSDLLVEGGFAFISGSNAVEGRVTILDIHDPANPRLHTQITGGGLQNLEVTAMAIQRNRLFLASNQQDTLFIYDISRLASDAVILPVGNISTAGGGDFISTLDNITDIEVVDNYVYVISDTDYRRNDLGVETIVDGGMTVVDVSNELAPVILATYPRGLDGFDPQLKKPYDIEIIGDYAYVAAQDTSLVTVPSVIQVLEISNPQFPTPIGKVADTQPGLAGKDPYRIAFHRDHAYVAGFDHSDSVSIFSVTSGKTANLNAGRVELSDLVARGSTRLSGDVEILNGLTVGSGGINLTGGISFQSRTVDPTGTSVLSFSDSAQFFSHADQGAEDHVFVFDTQDQFDTVASSTYLLSVRNAGTPAFSVASNGDVAASGTLFASRVNVGLGQPGDLAERVAVSASTTAGQVLVVDPQGVDTYMPSQSACAPAVAGVVSTRPTLVIGGTSAERSALLALTGRVPVLASAESGAIFAGDRLVTGQAPGTVKKYVPGECTQDGASVVGIALESLDQGTGKIMMLVQVGQSMQHIAQEQAQVVVNQIGGVAVDTGISFQNGKALLTADALDLNGKSLLGVKSIVGESFYIDEDGYLVRTIDQQGRSHAIYGVGSPDRTTMFAGSGRLAQGAWCTTFEETYGVLISSAESYQVQVTLTDPGTPVYVSKNDDGFCVYSQNGVQGFTSFDWVVFAQDGNSEEELVIQNNEPVEEQNGGEDQQEELQIQEQEPVENEQDQLLEEDVLVDEQEDDPEQEVLEEREEPDPVQEEESEPQDEEEAPPEQIQEEEPQENIPQEEDPNLEQENALPEEEPLLDEPVDEDVGKPIIDEEAPAVEQPLEE